ncbi:Panacea domain-containing protein [Flavobacterium johnsoniae]|uniref:Uncharacterized phage-associated protein n=1 Tax=Flavobacterium johnsoniae (strain ATCC 17061 / DSM 2064 / JCM 8514 / BCRC 14874 / CCUG 350202 / NBRC 14942 / NCIMB 11054 / UW101) TaxID=376686 RepID=A5FLG2_FLAJ1|nr:type II toxin-antitoxin system antitoxin SocA domain-containing protein [Flavobacterium johnsoniae]ABQ03955.1 Uncharacterized phage-associated protein [Flavobacterium johnsoniae UW101]OXE96173.1 hypothetical protein B0A63_21910 [Flavobacterium johnsoniae UW101]WQG79176.1 DUF4065 domain-containing protein [Flavobacterium johnsoniae UW101]SHK07917.1 Uncharacterized phage-associated protein [Flavobacterium johnsoniae]
MITIHQACDYIIFRLKSEESGSLNHLKLQKLLYYVQSWHLAFYGTRFFDGKFQAWIHGPVNRAIYDRFKDTKYMYSTIDLDDLSDTEITTKLPLEVKEHIDVVLETYAGFSDTDLESKTHQEEPWINARKGFKPSERCEVELDEKIMESYFKSRLN